MRHYRTIRQALWGEWCHLMFSIEDFFKKLVDKAYPNG